MNHHIFLLSMPGGAEWILVTLVILLLVILPVLAIVYFLMARRLQKENKELRDRIMEKNR